MKYYYNIYFLFFKVAGRSVPVVMPQSHSPNTATPPRPLRDSGISDNSVTSSCSHLLRAHNSNNNLVSLNFSLNLASNIAASSRLSHNSHDADDCLASGSPSSHRRDSDVSLSRVSSSFGRDSNSFNRRLQRSVMTSLELPSGKLRESDEVGRTNQVRAFCFHSSSLRLTFCM